MMIVRFEGIAFTLKNGLDLLKRIPGIQMLMYSFCNMFEILPDVIGLKTVINHILTNDRIAVDWSTGQGNKDPYEDLS